MPVACWCCLQVGSVQGGVTSQYMLLCGGSGAVDHIPGSWAAWRERVMIPLPPASLGCWGTYSSPGRSWGLFCMEGGGTEEGVQSHPLCLLLQLHKFWHVGSVHTFCSPLCKDHSEPWNPFRPEACIKGDASKLKDQFWSYAQLLSSFLLFWVYFLIHIGPCLTHHNC